MNRGLEMKVKRIVSNIDTQDIAAAKCFYQDVLGLDDAFERMKRAGFPIEYGPADEPWGVRRFYVRDPFGKLVNILAHVQSSTVQH
jgi:catechol 2,3-dioxygenase-like lactoylglutathione lyase family enzyme